MNFSFAITPKQSTKPHNHFILPDEIGSLSELNRLYLNNNQLTRLPETFGDLSALKRLYLEKNPFTFLPISFSTLTALTHLYLSRKNQSAHSEAFIGLTVHLIRRYLSDPSQLTPVMIDLLVRNLLPSGQTHLLSKLPPDDPLLIKIEERYSLRVNSGHKLLL